MKVVTWKLRALLLSVVMVLGAVCGSNGDNPAALVGQWVSMRDGKSVELFKDGTGVIGSGNITWKTEGKRFVLSSGNSSSVGDYNLSGYELTRTFEDGDVVVWVRKDKVEEYKKRNTSYFTDTRNGQKYRAVKIGNKKWLAENMNFQTGNSWCYEGNNANCEKYGRLYDWNTAKTVCPSGWHLPSREEWDNLVTAAGGKVAGKVLKATSGWSNYGNGVDGVGVSALPGGRRFTDGEFNSVGYYGFWWTATENDGEDAYYRGMYCTNDYVNEGNYGKGYAFSVRCISD